VVVQGGGGLALRADDLVGVKLDTKRIHVFAQDGNVV
jgi:hypothetical protein